MLPASYLILPQSYMGKTVEEEKQIIAWFDVPAKYQEKFAALAKEIREDYPEARNLEDDKFKKQAQSLTDTLSYLYKYGDEEDQKTYAELAAKMRTKYNFK